MEGISLRDYFAAKAMQAIISGNSKNGVLSYSEDAVADDAYDMVDAMLKERGWMMATDKDLNHTESSEWHVMFIGGPRHGEQCEMEDFPFIDHPPGRYHRHFLGIEDACFKMVYVWSELHSFEAVDLVFDALRDSANSSGRCKIEVAVSGKSTRISVDSGSKQVAVCLNKESVGVLIEELTKIFNEQ